MGDSHHWIPRSFVAAWLDKSLPKRLGQRVHLYGLDGKYLRWSHPSRIFALDELYTKVTASGERDLTTERMLGRIEDKFVRIRRSTLEKERPLTDEQTAFVALFVAALRNRSPRAFEHVNNFWREVVKIGDDLEAQLRHASKEERKRMAEASIGSGDKSKSMSLDEARHVAGLPIGATLPTHMRVEAPLLAAMSLTILQTGDPMGFITSDRPVVWWDPVPERQSGIFSIGLGHPDIEVTVPISPRQCLLFSHNVPAQYLDVSKEGLDAVNLRTLHRCDEVWLSHSDKLEVDWFDKDGNPMEDNPETLNAV